MLTWIWDSSCFIFIFNLFYASSCFVYMYVCAPCVCLVPTDTKKMMLDFLELEIEMVVSHHSET